MMVNHEKHNLNFNFQPKLKDDASHFPYWIRALKRAGDATGLTPYLILGSDCYDELYVLGKTKYALYLITANVTPEVTPIINHLCDTLSNSTDPLAFLRGAEQPVCPRDLIDKLADHYQLRMTASITTSHEELHLIRHEVGESIASFCCQIKTVAGKLNDNILTKFEVKDGSSGPCTVPIRPMELRGRNRSEKEAEKPSSPSSASSSSPTIPPSPATSFLSRGG